MQSTLHLTLMMSLICNIHATLVIIASTNSKKNLVPVL